MPLVCATVLFTPVSQGYKLIGFFLPLWLFITAANVRQTTTQPMLSAAANPLILLLFCLLIAFDDSGADS